MLAKVFSNFDYVKYQKGASLYVNQVMNEETSNYRGEKFIIAGVASNIGSKLKK
jgi:hypothetical protein